MSASDQDALNRRYDPMSREELIAECERLRDALYEIACGTGAWTRCQMIDHAQNTLFPKEPARG
jgi:hypothetical protein